jgi:hypothetical protein
MDKEEKRQLLDYENPIEYYNKHCIDSAIKIFKENKLFEVRALKDVYCMLENKSKLILTASSEGFKCVNSALIFEKDKNYDAFYILQNIKNNGDFYTSLSQAIEEMNVDSRFLKIGTKLYIKTNNELLNTDKENVMLFHGPSYLKKIRKYLGFTVEPDNFNYQQNVNEKYNLYNEFKHMPRMTNKETTEKDFPWTAMFLKHIFGEQYDIGLKYMKVLYEKPKQMLPILALVSSERQTGKTTFVDYLNVLFGDNVVNIGSKIITGEFNDAYAYSNIICIEEATFKDFRIIDKLKMISTQKSIVVNEKNISAFKMPFYGKLIITSNDERNFSNIDIDEIRYWVRKIPKFSGPGNHNILNDMRSEIPDFLKYLIENVEVELGFSRMVFTPEEIATSHLKVVQAESRDENLKSIEIVIDEMCKANTQVPEFHFTIKDFKDKFFPFDAKITRSLLNDILTNKMGLVKGANRRYAPLQTDSMINPVKVTGAAFTIKNPNYNELEKGNSFAEKFSDKY